MGFERRKTSGWIWRLVAVALVLAAATRGLADTITISAAISLKNALMDMGKAFDSDGKHQVVFDFGASGALEMQIQQGAPADVFISAGVKEMDELQKSGLIDAATRKNVAMNSLVLIVPAGMKNPPHAFMDLADPRFARISIGQPNSVPAGHYAKQTLQHLKLFDQLEPRMVYGENVRQVLEYVEQGEVDAGIVYATDALIGGKSVKVAAVADSSWHDPILYPAAVIKGRPNAAEADQFLEFVESDAGKKILMKYQFRVPAK